METETGGEGGEGITTKTFRTGKVKYSAPKRGGRRKVWLYTNHLLMYISLDWCLLEEK